MTAHARLAAAALVCAAGAAPALAHGPVAGTVPDEGASLARTPATITLRFDQAVARVGPMRLTLRGRGDLVKGVLLAPRDARRVLVAVRRPGRRAQAGFYRLTWSVTAVDGHRVRGALSFRVRR